MHPLQRPMQTYRKSQHTTTQLLASYTSLYPRVDLGTIECFEF